MTAFSPSPPRAVRATFFLVANTATAVLIPGLLEPVVLVRYPTHSILVECVLSALLAGFLGWIARRSSIGSLSTSVWMVTSLWFLVGSGFYLLSAGKHSDFWTDFFMPRQAYPGRLYFIFFTLLFLRGLFYSVGARISSAFPAATTDNARQVTQPRN